MDIIKCCSCDKEHEESGNCYYCGGMYGNGCDGVCSANCNFGMCQKCLDESEGSHVDLCNDCFMREYGDPSDPKYPDDSKDAMAHKLFNQFPNLGKSVVFTLPELPEEGIELNDIITIKGTAYRVTKINYNYEVLRNEINLEKETQYQKWVRERENIGQE